MSKVCLLLEPVGDVHREFHAVVTERRADVLHEELPPLRVVERDDRDAVVVQLVLEFFAAVDVEYVRRRPDTFTVLILHEVAHRSRPGLCQFCTVKLHLTASRAIFLA